MDFVSPSLSPKTYINFLSGLYMGSVQPLKCVNTICVCQASYKKNIFSIAVEVTEDQCEQLQ